MSKSSTKIQRRQRARVVAMQALFQWLHNPGGVSDLLEQCLVERGMLDIEDFDTEFCECLITGCIEQTATLDSLLQQFLDRPLQQLTSIELVVLRLATFELAQLPATPYKVVINEAVNLTKEYGAEGGHAYINAVLDKLARKLRKEEFKD
jgi:transcription antitermination factor NusB